MKRRAESQHTDPSGQAANRKTRAGRATAAAFAAVLALAACSDTDSSKPVTFPSYQEANDALRKLTFKFEDEGLASKQEEVQINESLEAAIPLFKKHVTDQLSDLVDNHKGSYKIVDDFEATNTYVIDSSFDDNNRRVDTLRLTSRGSNIAEPVDAFLQVTHEAEDEIGIKFRYVGGPGQPYSTVGDLRVDGNTLHIHNTVDADGKTTTHDLIYDGTEEFTHRFRTNDTVSGLEASYELLNNANVVLRDAVEAVTHGDKVLN